MSSRDGARALWLITGLALAATDARAAENEEASAEPQLRGFVDAYYAYNGNRPRDGANFLPGTGTTAKRANEFALNLASISLSAEPAPLGFQLVLGFGSAVEILHAGERIAPGLGPTVWHNVIAASVSWLAPIGRGLTIEGGIFPSHLGLEVLASKDDWTYTRSWMGELSPYYQAGVKASYAFGEHVAAQLHLLNGWQLIGENNEGKAVGTQLSFTSARATVTLNGFAGPELPDNGEDWRLFGDLVAILEATERLQFAVSADYGVQERTGLTTAHWRAAQASARYAITDRLAITGRAEIYDDRDGFITGTAQTLSDATLTLELRPVEQLILKLEGRFDHSTASVFTQHALTAAGTPELGRNELLAVAGAVATF